MIVVKYTLNIAIILITYYIVINCVYLMADILISLKKNGFSLIEVLISIFILSLSTLGAAAMQLNALRITQQSAYHSQGMHLATDMAETMRVYANSVADNDDRNPFLNTQYQSRTPVAPTQISCFAEAAPCSPEDMVQFELYAWQKNLGHTLPNGRALICRDSAPWDQHLSAFTWNCTGSKSSGAPIVIKLGWQQKNPDGSLIRDQNKQFAPAIALVVNL